MPKFRVTAEMVISVSTVVEAESAKEAIESAKERPVMTLCQQCSGGQPEEEWVTSGELDGEPSNVKAVADGGDD